MKNWTKNEVKEMIEGKLATHFGTTVDQATPELIYQCVALIVRDLLQKKSSQYQEQVKKVGGKTVYYLCMEFLVGKSLRNNLSNLGLSEVFAEAVKDYDTDLSELESIETDPGLGNGGLGRLAACFMDSLATQNFPAMGHSILYEYGLFKQKFVDGWQTEFPDIWLPEGKAWLVARPDEKAEVHFDGHIEEKWYNDRLCVNHYQYTTVDAIPYDLMISGKDSDAVTVLRLWQAQAPLSVNLNLFSQGEYLRSMEENNRAEAISKVLYPADNHTEGKLLRLRQQYFMVSASVQNIVTRHLKTYETLENFPDKVAIHINDTHPALVIPELMRIFMDECGYSWEAAWDLVVRTVGYTNHTVMAEALEVWDEGLFSSILPRIYQLVQEINRRFCAQLWERYPGNWDKIERMSILSQQKVRMANLAIVGSHQVNGVARIHSDILKTRVFNDFYNLYPERFTNVTNGIVHRRWLCQSNPELCALLDECIGAGYDKDAEKLEGLLKFYDDESVLKRLAEIKYHNKKRLADTLKKRSGIQISPDTLFDVQIKRLHEYKRQLLNALRIIALYLDLLNNPDMEMQPQTFLFGAKAAPSYYHAKRVMKLIHDLGAEIKKNPKIAEKLNVVFMEDYNVSLAEVIIPASEISEQISLAGKEASGTGNMKLMINGAVTLGTMDGANVEIYEAVGNDNIFVFGMHEDQVENMWATGYHPRFYYEQNPTIARVVNRLKVGFNGESYADIADYLLEGRPVSDPYMCLGDFADYMRIHDRATEAYQDPLHWNRMSLVNIAKAGRFSSDRSIREYCEKIWNVGAVTNDTL